MTDAIEVRKIGYRQSAKDGLVITFAVHPNDMPAALAGAPLGTRYMAALVEIGDDEKPVEQPVGAGLSWKVKGKRAWHELMLAEQAGIATNDPVFQAFMKENYGPSDLGPEISGEDIARAGIYDVCGVNSRSEILPDTDAAKKWIKLHDHFVAWKLAG